GRPRARRNCPVPEVPADRGQRKRFRNLTPVRLLAREPGSATVEELMPTYEDANIFAKMLRGEIPAYKVYEDDKSLAFLDIMPRAPGHTLVIPKSKARNILDVAPDDLTHVIKVTQKIARAAMRTFDAEGVTIQQFNESAGGQVVFHLHFHVIPRRAGVALKPPASEREKPDVLAEQAK